VLDTTPVLYPHVPGDRPRALSALWLDQLSVSFEGFKVLDGVTLLLNQGELRCLIGPTGAGKTTLLDVITGKTRPDEGRVFMNGGRIELSALNELEIARLGVCRKFQRPTVFESLSVLDNLELACAGARGVWHALFARLSSEQADSIDLTLATVGLTAHARRAAGLLSHGQKQWLEIGMLIVQSPRVLLLDEPVAGMTHAEKERTAELLLSLAGERTVLVVEHDMELVRSIARTVTVLHEGRVLAEGPLKKVQADPRVVALYPGE
jgi:urea transport system ATP-binding protein